MENELILGLTGNEILNILFKAMVVLVPIIWAIVKTKLNLDKRTENKIEQIMEKAVNDVYIEFVRDKKAESENGKLSKEQILEAQESAWQKTVDLSEKNGINIVDHVSKKYFPVLIDKIIGKMKGK